MPTSFQQQSPGQSLNFFQSAPSPQHGQKPEPECLKAKSAETRSFKPRPGFG